jgi:hypothetical protein
MAFGEADQRFHFLLYASSSRWVRKDVKLEFHRGVGEYNAQRVSGEV